MRELYLAKRRKRYQEQKEKHDEYYQKNKERIRNNTLLRRYGINITKYNEMFAKQKGCCAICKKHQTQFKKSLFIDHNHSTGEVRGLLCYQCNAILGMLFENTETLKEAVNYINKYNKEE